MMKVYNIEGISVALGSSISAITVIGRFEWIYSPLLVWAAKSGEGRWKLEDDQERRYAQMRRIL